MKLRIEGEVQAGRLWIAYGWVPLVLMAPREMPAGSSEQGDGEYAKTLDGCRVVCLSKELSAGGKGEGS